MKDLNELATKVKKGLESVSEIQVLYDKIAWDEQDSLFEKLGHIQLHLTKTMGKLAGICEEIEHFKQDKSEKLLSEKYPELLANISADLIHHSAQITEITGQTLGEAFIDRYKSNAKRFCPDSDFLKID